MSSMLFFGLSELAQRATAYVASGNLLYYRATYGMVLPSLVCSIFGENFVSSSTFCSQPQYCYRPITLANLERTSKLILSTLVIISCIYFDYVLIRTISRVTKSNMNALVDNSYLIQHACSIL